MNSCKTNLTNIKNEKDEDRFEKGTFDFTNDENNSNESNLLMKRNMYWRPLIGNSEPLDNQLRHIILDYQMTGRQLTANDIPFLRGVQAGTNIPDTETLIRAIERFGTVELFED